MIYELLTDMFLYLAFLFAFIDYFPFCPMILTVQVFKSAPSKLDEMQSGPWTPGSPDKNRFLDSKK